MSPERLFFALWPSDEVRAALVAERGLIAGEPSRPSHRLDLHMTLVFVGALAADARACVDAVGEWVLGSPFVIRLDAIVEWPGSGPGRGMWCATAAEVPRQLAELVGQLQNRLLRCGLQPERRAYRPHVTLARKAPSMVPQPVDLLWQVDDFVLAASRSGRRPSYEVLQRWPLSLSSAP